MNKMPAVVDFNYLSLNWWVSRISGCHPTLSTSPSFGWNFARSYRSSKATRCYSSSWAQALEKPQLGDAKRTCIPITYPSMVYLVGGFKPNGESSPSRGEHKKSWNKQQQKSPTCWVPMVNPISTNVKKSPSTTPRNWPVGFLQTLFQLSQTCEFGN